MERIFMKLEKKSLNKKISVLKQTTNIARHVIIILSDKDESFVKKSPS